MNNERQSNVIAAVFHDVSYRKEYHYFCKYPVKAGDHVIVDSPYNGYTCVKVVRVLPGDSMMATKHVIQVVDDTDYLASKERDKRIGQIRTQLKARQSKIAEITFFRQLALLDPASATLVAELEQLETAA